MRNAYKAIIIDAVSTGGKPGSIYFLKPEELPVNHSKVLEAIIREINH